MTVEFDKELMTLLVRGGSVPMIWVNSIAWFRGKDCANVLGYKDSKKAVKTHFEEEWQQSFEGLLKVGGVKCPPPLKRPDV